MFLLKDLVLLAPNSKLSATKENWKKHARLIQVIWRFEIKQPFLSLPDSQALQINGATGLLLQADMGRDKWHCQSWLCVATAEPP